MRGKSKETEMLSGDHFMQRILDGFDLAMRKQSLSLDGETLKEKFELRFLKRKKINFKNLLVPVLN